MKKVVVALFCTALLGLSLPVNNCRASQAEYYQMNKQKCEQYIELSQEAYTAEKNYEAVLYARKAVQEDPWSKKAWVNYNNILIGITKGNVDLVPSTFR